MATRTASAVDTADVTDPATIMIVDDDDEVRLVVAEFLQELGYRVLQAGGGVEALEKLQDTDALRMIISDVRMPVMSGLELADMAVQRRGDLKIILISGYFVSQQIGHRFLRKPFRMAELAAMVRDELAR